MEIRKLAVERGIPVKEVPIEKSDRTIRGNHQGVICYGSLVAWQRAEDIVPFIFEGGVDPLILILDRVTDVRNFGALCRTAECAGFHAVLVPAIGAAEVNADAVKSSAGAVFRINLCRSNRLKDTLKFFEGERHQGGGLHRKKPTTLFIPKTCADLWPSSWVPRRTVSRPSTSNCATLP